MDEKLKTTIDKIIKLTKQNPEFDTMLRKKLGLTSSEQAKSLSSDFDKRVEHIEKYLGLDYSVDGQPSLIDYSFVEDDKIRAQLVSDNREMMRYRYGTRFHIVNFEEYCRYAHLQIEMLLNYYYKKTDCKLDDIKKHIIRFNSTAKITDAKSIESISYNAKLWAFSEEHDVGKPTKKVINYVREVRNRASHRIPQSEEVTILEARERLTTKLLPIHAEDGYVLTNKIKEIPSKRDIFDNEIKNTEWYNEYLFLVWMHDQKFAEINEAIKEICNKIRNAFSA